jgi:LuxR family maltose regulon positive regulatory protein
MFTPLLQTKLHPPIPPSNLVSRPHLTGRLEAGSLRKLTLISAPAGFGKTILVCEWITAYKKPVAWFSLDEEDNDPVRFWAYFITALRTLQPVIGEAALDVLGDAQPAPIENILTALINEISSYTHDFFLVLDDYHLIETAEVHAAFEFLLQHQPQNLHLVITTRYDPPWSLHLLRSRQEMSELRQKDLSFSVDETEVLFNRALEFHLPAEDIKALQNRTEGWAVGLQLAAISMGEYRDPSVFFKGLAGNNRFIFEYLIEEVLQKQSPEIQDFLLKTSILEYLTAPLCNALLERENSQEILEYLTHANLFLTASDEEGRWYRYHHLFASLLRVQLERVRLDSSELHRRASHWLMDNHLAADALGHALRAKDLDLAIRIIEKNVLNLLETGVLASLSSWLKSIPQQRKFGRPWLCIAEAWIAVNVGQFDRVSFWLAHAGDILHRIQTETNAPKPEQSYAQAEIAHIKGHMALIDSSQSFFASEFTQAALKSRKALEYLPELDWLGRSQAWMNIAVGYQRTGKLEEALESNQKAITILEAAGRTKSVYHSPQIIQAGILFTKGQLRKVEAIDKSLIRAAQHGAIRSPIAGIALSGLSRIYRERNELDSALKCAEEGLEISRSWGNIDFVVSAYIDKAEILLSMGKVRTAFETLETGKRVFEDSTWPPLLATIEAELHLIGGDIDFASRWLQQTRLHPKDEVEYVQMEEYLVLARLLSAQARYAEAQELLARLQEIAERTGAVYRLIKILALRAVSFEALGQRKDALLALKQAVKLGENEGFVRAIIDAGNPIAGMLGELRADPHCLLSYIDTLIAGMPVRIQSEKANAELQGLIAPLSNREIEVLQLLDSCKTSNEIAGTLVIAVSTVRSHIKHIYAKLGVSRRFEAVQRARELGLI